MKNNLKSDTKMCFWEMKVCINAKEKKNKNMISVLTEMISKNNKKKKKSWIK